MALNECATGPLGPAGREQAGGAVGAAIERIPGPRTHPQPSPPAGASSPSSRPSLATSPVTSREIRARSC